MPRLLRASELGVWRARTCIGLAGVLVAMLGGAAKAAPPDGRAYEVVSPVSKNGGEVSLESTRTRAAVAGNAVAFSSLSAFADAVGTGVSVDYVSVRGPDGWMTHAVTPSQLAVTPGLLEQPFYMGDLSDDLSKGVFRAFSPVTDASNVDHVRNLYLRADLLSAGPGSYSLLSDSAVFQPIPPVPSAPTLADASDDFSHVIFESLLNLTPEASGDLMKLYEWTDGVLQLAGVLPDSACGSPPCIAASSAAGQGATGAGFSYTQGTLSGDGSNVFFTSPVGVNGDPAPGAQIYMRIDGVSTVRVNSSERATPDPVPADALYEMASQDGGKVFFTSAEHLTSTPEGGLYVYDTTKPDGASDNLTLVAAGTTGQIRVLGASQDGAVVYFSATSQLVSEAPDDQSWKIYRWEGGDIRYIGAFEQSQDAEINGMGANYVLFRKPSRVSPDGRVLVFVSRSGSGLTGFEHSDGCLATTGSFCSEVYVYDAAAAGGDGELMCASCNPAGASATSDATSATRVATGVSPTTSYLNRALSADGRRVFFTSGERLVPEDKNGLVRDVYVFDTISRAVSLISGGTGSSGSFFLDASANGDDVFFATRDRLVGRDVDNAYDVYDARVGGGFVEPGPPLAPCVGADGCRGLATNEPDGPAPPSLTFDGDDGGLGLVPVFRVLQLRGSQISRWAATGRVRVRVEVSEAGRVHARVRARIGGKVRVVAAASKRAGGGGLLGLRLRLSADARAVLAREGRLRVSIVVGYSPMLGVQRATVTLKQSPTAAGRAGGRGR